MRQLWLKIAYSNLWIALSAGGQVYVNYKLLDLPMDWSVAGLAVASMFWVYTFAKAVHFDPEADAINDPERTDFLKKNRVALIAVGLGGFLLGAWHCWTQSLWQLLVFLFPVLAGIFYDLRLLPGGRRLKDFPGVKGSTVAAAWTVLVLGLITLNGGTADSAVLLFLAWWNFNVWFINTTYFDLGDIVGDRAEGTRTLPVVLGYGRTRNWLYLLNGIGAASLWGAASIGWVSGAAYPALLIFAVHHYNLMMAKSEDSDISWECDVISDGIFVFAAMVIALIS